jgi:hypothetical protein
MVLVIGFRTSPLCPAGVGSYCYGGEDRLPDSPKYARITRCMKLAESQSVCARYSRVARFCRIPAVSVRSS